MRTTLILLVTSFLVACGGAAPVAVSATNNQEVDVETLFVHDGCTMYRFRDYYSYHYYARCDGRSAASVQTLSRVSCGKNCVRPDDIATEETDRRASSAPQGQAAAPPNAIP